MQLNSGILNSLHEQANCCDEGGNAQDVNLGNFTFFFFAACFPFWPFGSSQLMENFGFILLEPNGALVFLPLSQLIVFYF